MLAFQGGHPPILEIGALSTTCDYVGVYSIESYVDSFIHTR
jgi:hypothetical protein